MAGKARWYWGRLVDVLKAASSADTEEGSLQRAGPLICHPVYLCLSGQTPAPLLMHVDQHSNFITKRSILMGHGMLQSSTPQPPTPTNPQHWPGLHHCISRGWIFHKVICGRVPPCSVVIPRFYTSLSPLVLPPPLFNNSSWKPRMVMPSSIYNVTPLVINIIKHLIRPLDACQRGGLNQCKSSGQGARLFWTDYNTKWIVLLIGGGPSAIALACQREEDVSPGPAADKHKLAYKPELLSLSLQHKQSNQ